MKRSGPPSHTLLWRDKPARAEAHILGVIIGGLALDASLGWTGQMLASAWTALVFGWLYLKGGSLERRVLITCLLIAALGETLLSLGWGLYDYRLRNVPLFVPPGHALLMSLGLMLVPRVPAFAIALVPLAAAPYVALGLWQGWDTAGAALFLLFALCMGISRGRPLYAVMFVLSLLLELYGTWLGNWAWKPVVPGLGLTTTNPPLNAGACYCALDLLVIACLRLAWPLRPARSSA